MAKFGEKRNWQLEDSGECCGTCYYWELDKMAYEMQLEAISGMVDRLGEELRGLIEQTNANSPCTGWCHRFPPAVSISSTSLAKYVINKTSPFLGTVSNSWCGEWRE